tara:strand:+ start:5456 stop:6034 length:579 start_codon:yes stop_codon:yes gene_type:complete
MDINNRLNNHELPGLTSPFDPQIYECPHHAMIQEILINWVTENAKTRVNGGALKTKFYNGNERDLRAHGLLFDWIVLTIKDAVDQFSRFTNSAYNESAEETKVFKIADYWGMMYDVGGGTVLHNHFPYSISFGYYLCTPDGSSPLIIEGKEIQVTEGRLIIFGGHQSHEVPDSDISGRCMIAGNIAYTGAIE